MGRLLSGIFALLVVGADALAEPRPFPPKTGPDPRVIGPPARAPSHPGGYATRLDYPGVERPSHGPRPGASTYVYLHTLPPRLSNARERYRARLHLTLEPIFPSRVLQDLPDDQLRTELDLLWTPRTDLANPPAADDADQAGAADADPWDLLSAGLFITASERFIDLAIDAPGDPAPKLGYALSRLAHGDLAGAQFALRRAVEMADGVPALSEAQFESARVILGAITTSLAAHVEEAPTDFDAHLTLAIIMLIRGDQDSARDHARRARDLRPRDPVAILLADRLEPPADPSSSHD